MPEPFRLDSARVTSQPRPFNSKSIDVTISRTTQTAILVLLGTACGGGSSNPTPPPPPPPATPASLAISAGDQQHASPGQAVGIAPAVVVRDAAQQPVAGVTVQFAVTAGGGSLQGASPVTDAAGVARLGRWTLGSSGQQGLTATAGSLPAVTFRATITGDTDDGRLETSIGTGGGTFEITTADHPYRGLRLSVPAGTFGGTLQMSFEVVRQPILPALPAGFRVSGPVLAVSSSQGRGADLMALQVPISPRQGEQVLLAFHDPVSRLTELLPVAYRDDTLLVALTGHLRPDLLNGPGLASFRQDDPVGWLMPVAYPSPLPSVPSVLPANLRWPVLDHGSAAMPQGFGAAIPALQSIAAALGRPLSQLEPGLATPGFYGDGAQLAAVTRAARATANVAQSVARYVTRSAEAVQQVGGTGGKGASDELTNELIVASLALNQKPFPVALVRSGTGAGSPVVVTAVSGNASSVDVLAPAVEAVASMTREAAGFVQLAVQSVAGGTPVQVDRAVPLSSFLIDFKQVATTVGRLVEVSSMAVGSAARIAATTAMEAEAGLPEVKLNIEAYPGAGSAALVEEPIVVRSKDAELTIPAIGGSTGVQVHRSGGDLTAEASGTRLAFKAIGALEAAGDLEVTELVLSPVRQLAEGVKQVAARLISVVKAPFDVEPTEAKISEPMERLTFTASVPRPPSAGYGISWEWDGGHIRAFQNTTTAELEFIEVKDYTVIATLHSLVGGADLAVDTVKVVVDQPRHWHLATFIDVDNMLNDPDNEVSGDIPEQLLAILRDPATTMLSVVQTTANSTELQLRTMMNGTHWNPTPCCPPVPPGSPRSLVLGFDPAETRQYGSYFSEWNSAHWTESTSDQNSGTLTSQRGLGANHVYKIKDIGSQVGPSGAVRLLATRNGDMISGRITFVIWFEDDEDGEMEEPAEQYRFDFTAKRIR